MPRYFLKIRYFLRIGFFDGFFFFFNLSAIVGYFYSSNPAKECAKGHTLVQKVNNNESI